MFLVIFLIALAPRVMISLSSPQLPWQHWDVSHDVLIARNLVSGHGFANAPGQPTAYRYPLMPLVLSAFFRVLGERYIPVMLFQALLGSLTAAMIFLIGRKALGNTVGIIAGLFTALDPELISLTRIMLTETLFSFLLTLTALCFMAVYRRRNAAICLLAGLLIGLSALCRPVSALWAVLFSIPLVSSASSPRDLRGRLVCVLLMVLLSMAVVSPWIIRNQRVMGSPVFNTSGGLTFWIWGHNHAEPADETTVLPVEFTQVNLSADPRAFFNGEGGDPAEIAPLFSMQPGYQGFSYEQRVVDRVAGLDEVEADREFMRMALEHVREYPLDTLLHSFRSLFRTLAWTEMNGRMNILLAVVMPFILLGMHRVSRGSQDVWHVVLSVLLSMLLVHFIFYFDHRFRIPYQPFMMIPAAAGISTFWKGELSRREKVLFLSFFIMIVIVNYFEIRGPQTG